MRPAIQLGVAASATEPLHVGDRLPFAPILQSFLVRTCDGRDLTPLVEQANWEQQPQDAPTDRR